MVSDFSHTAHENIKTRAKSSKKVEKTLKRLLFIAGIILVAELIWLFVISPFIPFSTIDAYGFSEFTRAEILRLAAIDETSSFMSTNVMEVQNRLLNNILVESAKVSKRFPDKLTISLVPRRAAAVTLTDNGGRQNLLYIDTHGVFYKIGETASTEYAGLPVLSGIENPQLNMQLPAGLIPLVENISAIAAGSPELLSAISEIKIEQKAWDGYDLLLYPVHSSIRVRVENNLTEEVLRFMLLMLNVFENDSSAPAEIDFRSGMGSYKIKENSLW